MLPHVWWSALHHSGSTKLGQLPVDRCHVDIAGRVWSHQQSTGRGDIDLWAIKKKRDITGPDEALLPCTCCFYGISCMQHALRKHGAMGQHHGNHSSSQQLSTATFVPLHWNVIMSWHEGKSPQAEQCIQILGGKQIWINGLGIWTAQWLHLCKLRFLI